MIATSPWRAAIALSAHSQEEKWLVIAVPWLLVDRNGHLTEWRIGWQEGDGRAEIEGVVMLQLTNARAHNENVLVHFRGWRDLLVTGRRASKVGALLCFAWLDGFV
jgi:hypothetical protein